MVFDVNVLVRACLGSSRINALLEECIQRNCTLLTSQLLVDEFAHTARKPRLLNRINWGTYNDILALFATVGEDVRIESPFPECRDEGDRYLLGMVEAGDADYLITADRDLLCLRVIGQCQIVTPEAFEVILGT